MKMYRNACISFVLMFTCTLTHSLLKKQQSRKTDKAQSSSNQAIIFDLTNVLFKENQIGFAKKVGYGTLASYTLTHWKSPGYRCLDMLAAMSTHDAQKPHITITLKGRTLPRCLIELQEGKKNCAQTKAEIAQCIEHLDKTKFFSSIKEKELMQTIMNLVLDPHVITTITEPIKPTIQLIQKLKSAGHPVYLFANVPEEFYSAVEKNHPDILQLFDGIVISAHVKSVKPDNTIFNHLFTTHKLDPKNCILIDDLKETTDVAQKLGMQAIVYDKISHVTQKLKRYGVRI